MKRIRTAIFGTGLSGRVHLEALRRVEFVDVAAIAGRNAAAAEKLGAAFGVPGVERPDNPESDPSIDAVHICTPNAQRLPIARDALLAGKHVLCEKPLATTVKEQKSWLPFAARRRLRACVCHNLRFYPMVQQMRSMREAGELGEILAVVQGAYSAGLALLTILTGTGALTQKSEASHAASQLSAPTGLTPQSTSLACACRRSAPISRPSIRVSAGSQNIPSKPLPMNFTARAITSKPTSIPKIAAQSYSVWESAPAVR